MRIKWFGHSCFLLSSESGTKVLCDPCDPKTGYILPKLEADVVTISHNHYDHCYLDAVDKSPVIISTPGITQAAGIEFRGIPSYHDDKKGALRGENIIFKFEIDGIKFVHAGDIGYFDEALCEQIGETDVLLVPIGGVYTINAAQAREFANMLKARMVIPMHYKTTALTFDLGDIDTFVDNAVDCSIHRLGETEAVLSKEFLGNNRILILSYK